MWAVFFHDVFQESSLLFLWVGAWNILTMLVGDSRVLPNVGLVVLGLLFRVYVCVVDARERRRLDEAVQQLRQCTESID